jgi:hypothetical protein
MGPNLLAGRSRSWFLTTTGLILLSAALLNGGWQFAGLSRVARRLRAEKDFLHRGMEEGKASAAGAGGAQEGVPPAKPSKHILFNWPEAGGPRYLAVLPLLGLKYGRGSGGVGVERLAIRAWDRLAQVAGEGPWGSIGVLGLVDADADCDPELLGLGSFRCLALPHCRHPKLGVMQLDCAFGAALRAAVHGDRPADMVIFANGDVMFAPEVLPALNFTRAVMPGAFVLVGRRIDLNITIPKDGEPPLTEEALLSPSLTSKLHAAMGVDYFAFPPNAFPRGFPPFLVGRWKWDNALLAGMMARRVPAIDASSVVQAFHVGMHRHDADYHSSRPGAAENTALADGYLGGAFSLGHLDNTDLVLRVKGAKPGAIYDGEAPLQLRRRRASADRHAITAIGMSVVLPVGGAADGGSEAAARQAGGGEVGGGGQRTLLLVSVPVGAARAALSWACWADRYGLPAPLFLVATEREAAVLRAAGRRVTSVAKPASPREGAQLDLDLLLERQHAQLLRRLLRYGVAVAAADARWLWAQDYLLGERGRAAAAGACDLSTLAHQPSGPCYPTSPLAPLAILRPTTASEALMDQILACHALRSRQEAAGSQASEEDCVATAPQRVPGLRHCRLGGGASDGPGIDAAVPWASASGHPQPSPALFKLPLRRGPGCAKPAGEGDGEGAGALEPPRSRLELWDARAARCDKPTQGQPQWQPPEGALSLGAHVLAGGAAAPLRRALDEVRTAAERRADVGGGGVGALAKRGWDALLRLAGCRIRMRLSVSGPGAEGALGKVRTVRRWVGRGVATLEGEHRWLNARSEDDDKAMLVLEEGVELSPRAAAVALRAMERWLAADPPRARGGAAHDPRPALMGVVLAFEGGSDWPSGLPLAFRYQPRGVRAMLWAPGAWDAFRAWAHTRTPAGDASLAPLCGAAGAAGAGQLARYIEAYAVERGMFAVSLRTARGALLGRREGAGAGAGAPLVRTDVEVRQLLEAAGGGLDALPLFDVAMEPVGGGVALQVRGRAAAEEGGECGALGRGAMKGGV